jgi:hypothetical protein
MGMSVVPDGARERPRSVQLSTRRDLGVTGKTVRSRPAGENFFGCKSAVRVRRDREESISSISVTKPGIHIKQVGVTQAAGETLMTSDKGILRLVSCIAVHGVVATHTPDYTTVQS